MKKFNFVITGTLNAQVKATNQEEAEQILEDWLEDNSPVRNWEFEEDYSETEQDFIDIKLSE